MEEPKSLKDKLRAAIFGKALPSEGWGRLAVLVVSLVAAKAALRLAVSLLVVGGLVFWVISRTETGSPDQSEARRQAEETRQMVDETREKAEAIRREAMIRKQEEAVENAVRMVDATMTAYYIDRSRMTGNLDDLVDHGFLRNPDLIYELRLAQRADGSPAFTVEVSHREKGPRAFRYDSSSGRGVEPVELEQ